MSSATALKIFINISFLGLLDIGNYSALLSCEAKFLLKLVITGILKVYFPKFNSFLSLNMINAWINAIVWKDVW